MVLSALSNKQLKAMYASLGGRKGNYKRETLIERIGVLQGGKASVAPSNSILDTPPASQETGVGGEKGVVGLEDRNVPPPKFFPISVLPAETPAEPLTVAPQAFAETLGMVTPAHVHVHRAQVGGLSEEQILQATSPHRERGMTVKFADGCWEFRRGDRVDTGNMAMPVQAAVKAADLVMQASISAARVLKNAQQA